MTSRRLWAVLLVALGYGLVATPAHAALPSDAGTPFGAPHVCSDRDELGGVLFVEGGAQPTADIIRMGQIIRAESEQRGLSICALTRLTNFVSVRHYARANPNSWTARNIDNPPEWILDIASDILTDKYPDLTVGARHFDGDGTRILFRP